jgi:hypothetical protein
MDTDIHSNQVMYDSFIISLFLLIFYIPFILFFQISLIFVSIDLGCLKILKLIEKTPSLCRTKNVILLDKIALFRTKLHFVGLKMCFVGLNMLFCRTTLHFVGLNMRNVGLKMHFVGLKLHFVELKMSDHICKMSD